MGKGFQKGHRPPPGAGKGPRRRFPPEGTAEERAAFFRDEYLSLAYRTSDIELKERLLGKAMAADRKANPEPEKPVGGAARDAAEEERALYEEFKKRRDGDT